jgi:hypothetical protein
LIKGTLFAWRVFFYQGHALGPRERTAYPSSVRAQGSHPNSYSVFFRLKGINALDFEMTFELARSSSSKNPRINMMGSQNCGFLGEVQEGVICDWKLR